MNAQVSLTGQAPKAVSATGVAGSTSSILTTTVARGLPIVLLAISSLAVLFTHDIADHGPYRLGAAAALVVLVVVLRGTSEKLFRQMPAEWRGWPVVWGLHAVVVFALVLANPLFCIYAFAGYVDAERFLPGRPGVVAVVVTAVTCAVGQAGGVEGIWDLPWLFAALLCVNVVIATAMMRLAIARDHSVQARETAAEELARVHRKNLDLQDDLMAQAHERGIAAERERLSREIHDTIAQGLVAVITQLENVPQAGDEVTRNRVERAEEAARSSLAEARRAVRALASPLLDDHDLHGAMTSLVESWSRTCGLPAQFRAEGASGDFRNGDVLIRVTQEALSNIARHADASHVMVTLTCTTDEVRIDIRDDGRGFDDRTAHRGHGLGSMSDRVSALGGTLRLETGTGAGCTVSAAVPR